MRRHRGRSGITLIEVLVVVGIVGLLITLVLPAVSGAREAGRRVQCLNNLRQLGIAVANYAGRSGVMPQGYRGSSIHVMILPDLEQAVLYNMLNFQAGDQLLPMALKDNNETARRVALSVFICPSDTPRVAGANVSYAGNTGTGFRDGWNGMFSLTGRPAVYPGSVTDGMSQTVAMTEWLFGPTERAPDERRSVLMTKAWRSRPEEYDRFVFDCQALDVRTSLGLSVGKGEDWSRGDLGRTLYNHINGINGRTCTNSGNILQGAWTAGSTHPGGANSLFGDGHVRTMKQTTATAVWRGLGTRNGGEPISAE